MGHAARSAGAAAERVALVFAGGDPPIATLLDDLPDDALVVAADAGLHHATALHRRVDVVVGDLDSVDPAALAGAEAVGADVERHPVDKDATDLELALATARDRGATRLVVLGAGGGRLDHFLANALALAGSGLADVRVEARIGDDTVHVVRDTLDVHASVGDHVTLLPVGGAAHGVVTSGLRYALRGESLPAGSTRGVSNVVVTSPVRVTVADGVLLVILPRRREGSS